VISFSNREGSAARNAELVHGRERRRAPRLGAEDNDRRNGHACLRSEGVASSRGLGRELERRNSVFSDFSYRRQRRHVSAAAASCTSTSQRRALRARVRRDPPQGRRARGEKLDARPLEP
jgi:hypothetical protein